MKVVNESRAKLVQIDNYDRFNLYMKIFAVSIYVQFNSVSF